MRRDTLTLRALISAFLAVGLGPGIVLAAQDDAAGQQIDGIRGIEDHLRSEGVRDSGNYTIRFDNGAVILDGSAPTLNTIDRIEEEVGEVVGVLPIVNRLTVSPVSATDGELAARVRNAVRGYPHFNIFDWVTGSVVDGVAYISGEVREPWDRSGYEYRVGDIPGIRRIVSTIEDLPLSTDDDRIRVLAARALYGDSNFWKYATRAHAPVHIIVHNGHIRLEGIVLNRMERQLVEDRVRHGVIALSLVNNLETDS